MARSGGAPLGLHVSEAELRELCVKRLELLVEDEFEKSVKEEYARAHSLVLLAHTTLDEVFRVAS